jgi:hypothetical protein
MASSRSLPPHAVRVPTYVELVGAIDADDAEALRPNTLHAWMHDSRQVREDRRRVAVRGTLALGRLA